jgi:uncharacterized LabA/DUF88 family protein
MENKKIKLKIKKKTLLIVDWANVYGWRKSVGWEVCPKKLFAFFDRPKIVEKRFYHGVENGQKKSENFKIEMEELGFNVISKEVKWPPVLLEKQNHFKKIIKDLFNVLDNVKTTNSELSNKLYELTRKIKELQKIEEKNEGVINLSSEKELKEIFELIEELDSDLKNLNIDIGNLQDGLKKPVYRRKCDFDVEITRDALNEIDNYDTLLLFSGDGDYFALTEDLIKKGKKVILVFAEGHKGREYDKIKNSLFYACSVGNLENFIKK